MAYGGRQMLYDMQTDAAHALMSSGGRLMAGAAGDSVATRSLGAMLMAQGRGALADAGDLGWMARGAPVVSGAMVAGQSLATGSSVRTSLGRGIAAGVGAGLGGTAGGVIAGPPGAFVGATLGSAGGELAYDNAGVAVSAAEDVWNEF